MYSPLLLGAEGLETENPPAWVANSLVGCAFMVLPSTVRRKRSSTAEWASERPASERPVAGSRVLAASPAFGKLELDNFGDNGSGKLHIYRRRLQEKHLHW